MPIDPTDLAKSIGALGSLDPERGLARTLQQVTDGAKQLFRADAAGLMLIDAEGQLRWASASDQTAQTLEDRQERLAQGPCAVAFSQRLPAAIRNIHTEPDWDKFAQVLVGEGICAALSVPVELDGGIIGTLDIYAREARDWDPSEVAALQAYAGLMASLLSAAVTAQVKGRLADQLQAALEHRWLIEQAKGVIMGREQVDAQAAFERLRGAARSSTRRLADVAKDVTGGQPLPANRRKLAKSRGDALTPSDALERFGADALRYWAASKRAGVDTSLDEGQLRVGRRLATKLLHASRFVLALDGRAAVLGLERLDQVVLAEALVAVGALDQRVGERLQVPGGLPDPGGHDDGRVLADHVVAQLHDRAPPGLLDVVLQLDPERTVVVARADPAVDLARLEGEAAALGQVDDRVHRVAWH